MKSLILLNSLLLGTTISDADSDYFYIPDSLCHPALIILSCTGATFDDLSSIRFIADSLGIILATCHKSRNHRDINLNDRDIMWTVEKLLQNYKVEPGQVFIYGFSGMGVQALLELFLHPQTFRGAIAACAHKGAMPFADFSRLHNHSVYLISRKKDWNLNDNILMHNLFKGSGIIDTLIVKNGEHSVPSSQELYNAIKWLLEKISTSHGNPDN